MTIDKKKSDSQMKVFPQNDKTGKMMENLESECRRILNQTKESFIDLGEEDEPENQMEINHN